MSHLQYTFSFDSPSYFNTTGLEGERLEEKKAGAKTQEAQVLEIFHAHPEITFTRDEICEKLNADCPVSYGRAMTNLMNKGKLERTDIKRLGTIYKGINPQHAYKLIPQQ